MWQTAHGRRAVWLRARTRGGVRGGDRSRDAGGRGQDDAARLADDVARLGDDAARAATAGADDAARAAASVTDDVARAGTDGLRVLGYPPGYPAYLTSNPYAGVQQASACLGSQGVPQSSTNKPLSRLTSRPFASVPTGPDELDTHYSDDAKAIAK